MQDILYECLIRQAYQCGRDYKRGADAVIYREMEQAHTDLTTKSMFNTQEEREYEFRKRFTAVRNYVDKAITEGIKQIKGSASSEEITSLESMQGSLNFSFYDKDKLDEMINRASHLFNLKGLKG